MIKLKAKELRTLQPTDKQKQNLKKNPIYIILDNVMDTYNIGAIFRLADAVAAKKVLLCGESETPPNSRIKKASIDTTNWVNWEYFDSTTKAIKSLKEEVSNISIIAIEQNKKSVNYTNVNYKLPVALVVGHETLGVSDEVLKLCDFIIEIPMYGVNISLNVMVSLGIVLYKVVEIIAVIP